MLEEEVSEKIIGNSSQSLYKAKNNSVFSPANMDSIIHEASGELTKSLLPSLLGPN